MRRPSTIPTPTTRGFFGVFFGLATGAAFLLSLFVTNRLLARFGVPTVLLVLPLLYVVAFGVLTVESRFVLLVVFRFAQVAWLLGRREQLI